MELTSLGFNSELDASSSPYLEHGLIPARVACEHRHSYVVYCRHGELLAEVKGKLRYESAGRSGLPVVGDWVMIDARPLEGSATIHAILPRRSIFSRRPPDSTTQEQIVAANVDTIFLVASLNDELNLRRIERYLPALWASGATPIILLNKADLCEDAPARLAEVQGSAIGVTVHLVSALRGDGLEVIRSYLRPGVTIAVVGSSGVGKSTLINTLLGEERIRTSAVSAERDKGRHTTTRRELVPVPTGGLLLDTPGMKTFALAVDESAVDDAFGDIDAIASHCRFRDCTHRAEPGCAIRAALEEGSLSPERWASYQKLQREVRYAQCQQDDTARRMEQLRWKKIAKLQKTLKKLSFDDL